MRLLLFLLCLAPLTARGQSTIGLIAYYPFEGNLGDATGDGTNLGVAGGAVDFDCGVEGAGLLLSNPGDFVRLPGGASNNVNRLFDDGDFTVDLTFKSIGGTDEQYLFSKRDSSCTADGQYVSLRYTPSIRQLTATLQQGNVRIDLVHTIDNDACWQQVSLVRELTRVSLFLNGSEVATQSSSARIDVDNAGDLLLGTSACLSAGEAGFRGLIDEVRIYDQALTQQEIAQLYPAPDRILTPNTRLFLGESVTIDLNSNCGTGFSWSPTRGVATPDIAEPTITGEVEGSRLYTVSITDDLTNCVARDSVRIIVIDPATLDCGAIFLPKAFTPNGIGPAQNETFGISNPFAISELVVFTIYDRNGGKVFSTTDPFARWDGTFGGKPMNPGVLLWQLAYRCEGQDLSQAGSVTILR